MRLSIIIVSVILLTACASNQDNIETVKKSVEFERVSTDFLPLPFGQPKSSTFENYIWGNLEGEKRDAARKAANDFASASYGLMEKVLEGIDVDNVHELAQSLAVMEERLDVFRNEEDTFLAEQYLAFRIERTLFNNKLFSKEELEKNKTARLDNSGIEVLNFVTKLFIRNANPNAELMALNVHHLAGNVDSAILAKYARESIENAENWFGSERLCLDCVSKTNPAITLDGKMESVLSGIQYLEQFTGN